MRKIMMVCSLLLLTLAFGQRAAAQESTSVPQQPKAQEAAPEPEHFYRLEFVVEELNSDGKPVNSRSYFTTIATGQHISTSIRTNSRIPIAAGIHETNGKENTVYDYENVGVNFDVLHVHEVGRQLALDVTADITAAFPPSDPAQMRQPVERQNRWQASVLIPMAKSMAIFSSDSTDSKDSMRVLVTATPIQ